MSNYQRGYDAGLNGWRFDMELSNDKDYLDGWNAGWKKRYFRDKSNG